MNDKEKIMVIIAVINNNPRITKIIYQSTFKKLILIFIFRTFLIMKPIGTIMANRLEKSNLPKVIINIKLIGLRRIKSSEPVLIAFERVPRFGLIMPLYNALITCAVQTNITTSFLDQPAISSI